MESQPQNPEFRNNPENFHPWDLTRGIISYEIYYLNKPSSSLINLI